jgi:hypothetical protein
VSDGVPLQQLLEPGEYRVEWSLPSQTGTIITLPGDLELRADRPPQGNAYGEGLASWQFDGTTRSGGFPQVYESSSVKGQLINGQHVVLVDVIIEVWIEDRVILHSRAALIGRSPLESDDIDIKSLSVQIEGTDAISGIPPIQKVKIPSGSREGKSYLDWSWEAVGQPSSTQVWSDAAAEMELQFYSSVTAPEGFFFRVSFSPVIRVIFLTSTEFDGVFARWVEPLRRIVALSTGRDERITFLSIGVRDPRDSASELEFQVYGTGLHQRPFSSRGNDILKIERAFFISPDDMSLLGLLRRWQELDDAHHPLLETYASLMFTPDQHPRSRFLLLLQAIEGLHGFETRQDFDGRVLEHTQRRREVIDEAAGNIGPESLKFLRKYLMKRPPSSLDTALTSVLSGVPVNVTATLGKTSLVQRLMNDGRTPKQVAECLRLIRNDLAHGTRGYDPNELHEVVKILDHVVRAHLLRLLGCSEEAQKRTQERR